MSNPDRSAALLADMVTNQQDKVRDLARRIVPEATDEDLRNPQDLELLRDNSHFNYEDGVLSGLESALMAVRSL